jgi:hypothetical protein
MSRDLQLNQLSNLVQPQSGLQSPTTASLQQPSQMTKMSPGAPTTPPHGHHTSPQPQGIMPLAGSMQIMQGQQPGGVSPLARPPAQQFSQG